MPYRPSDDPAINKVASSALWSAIETAFDNAIPLTPLKRGDFRQMQSDYIRERSGDENRSAEGFFARLPPGFEAFRLGITDAEVIDFLLNSTGPRTLALVGPPGAGKSSLLHFTEAAIENVLDRPPPFLILDGLKLDKSANLEDWLGLLVDELRGRSGPHTSAFGAAASFLDSNRTYEGLRRTAVQLANTLPPTGTIPLVLAFDNLDHLSLPTIEILFEAAKQIVRSSDLGSIISLRPANIRAMRDRGIARAFFHFSLTVHPPAVQRWIQTFDVRLPAAVDALITKTGRPLRAYNTDLTPPIFNSFGTRLIDLLSGNRTGENVLRVIEAASADNLRSVALLVRRFLSHSDLPGRWLIGIDPTHDVNPLKCLFEGDHNLMKPGPCVPNVLTHSSSPGSDLLLPTRILLAVESAGKVIRTSRLYRILENHGFMQQSTASCLSDLASSGLISGADHEYISAGEVPSLLTITDSGRFFLDHLIRNPMYLTCAVMDVKLEHVTFRQNGDSFASRVASLSEYAQRVRTLEQSDLSSLLRAEPSPEVLEALAALSSGGLLTAALAVGLDLCLSRLRGSRAQPSNAIAEAIRTLGKLQSWLAGADERVSEAIVNTKRRLGELFARPPVGATVGVEYDQREAVVQVVQKGPQDGGEHSTLRITEFSKRCGFLVVEESGASARLTFYTAGDGIIGYELSELSDLAGTQTWCASQMAEVGALVTSGKTFESKVKTIGVELAHRLMETPALHYLQSFYNLIDTLIVVTTRTAIPWEWIWPRVDIDDALALGDHWRIIRWPGGAMELSLAAIGVGTALPITTFGLDDRTVEDISAIIEGSKGSNTLHLVGRHCDGALQLGSGYRLEYAAIVAHVRRTVRNVIISACDVGSAESCVNLAAAFTKSWRCATLAPLVSVLDTHAREVDRRIRSFVERVPGATLDDVLREERLTMPILKLYARYGFFLPKAVKQEEKR